MLLLLLLLFLPFYCLLLLVVAVVLVVSVVACCCCCCLLLMLLLLLLLLLVVACCCCCCLLLHHCSFIPQGDNEKVLGFEPIEIMDRNCQDKIPNMQVRTEHRVQLAMPFNSVKKSEGSRRWIQDFSRANNNVRPHAIAYTSTIAILWLSKMISPRVGSRGGGGGGG